MTYGEVILEYAKELDINLGKGKMDVLCTSLNLPDFPVSLKFLKSKHF